MARHVEQINGVKFEHFRDFCRKSKYSIYEICYHLHVIINLATNINIWYSKLLSRLCYCCDSYVFQQSLESLSFTSEEVVFTMQKTTIDKPSLPG